MVAQEVPIADVPLADNAQWEGAWSKPLAAPEAGRLLSAGGRGTILVKAWWGEGLRPPSGSSWRLDIAYRDTATTPIVADIFAGLPAWRTMHHFGGTADQAVKVARIPLPWDMVMRMPGTDHTGLALQAPAGTDILIQSVRVVRGNPLADETRWQTETREWVGRVQADKRATAKQPPADVAVLSPTHSQQKVVPFTRSWLKPINLNSAPLAGETDSALTLRMARNETEPGQFGVYAASGDALGCTVDLSALKAKDGTVLNAAVELLTAEYAVISDGTLRAQRLWPAFPVDIRKGESHMFVLRVTTDAKTSVPGIYSGTIAIRGEAVDASLNVSVEVLPITLLTMAEANLHMTMCADSLLPSHELEVMAKNNLNGLCFFSYALPIELKKQSATDFTIDFTVADDFMLNAAAAGIKNVVYYMGGDPYGFPDTLHILRELYRRVAYAGTDMMAGRLELVKYIAAHDGMIPPELRVLYKQWVAQFLGHAEKSGWPEIYLSPFDEPAKWVQKGWGSAEFYYYRDAKSGQEVVARTMTKDKDAWLKAQAAAGNKPEFLCSSGAGAWIKPSFKDQCAAIHEAYPKARIYASIHHAEPGAPFRDDVDIYCSDAIHEDREMGEYVKQANDPKKWYWLYDFSRDAGDPANMRYIFGFFHSAFDTSGSLCWAYNWAGKYDSSVGEGPSLFAYTSPYGVITQPQFDGLREALDDRRYIETLKRLAAAKGQSDAIGVFLKALAAKSGRNRPGGKWDNVEMLYRELNDSDALDHLRGEVIDQLLKLK